MIIVKGQLTQQLVTTTLRELGIQKPDEENYICELTQDCRHIFFIPLFPLRTYWIIKNPTGEEIYNSNVEKRLISIEKKFKAKKIASWAGLVVLVFILFLPVGIFYFSEWRIENERENEQQAIYETTIQLLKSPSVTNYYNFEIDKSVKKQAGYYTYKVNKIKNDSVQFVLLYDNDSYGGHDEYGKNRLIQITIENIVYNSFWIKKESLMQLFLNFSATPQRNLPLHVMNNNHDTLTLLRLSRITVVSGPSFNMTENYPGKTKYIIVNEGFDTRIDSIEVPTENVAWTIPTGKIIHHNDSLPISVTGKGKAYVYCSDSLGSYKIDFSREKDFLYITNESPFVY